jgi:hypothetical protein
MRILIAIAALVTVSSCAGQIADGEDVEESNQEIRLATGAAMLDGYATSGGVSVTRLAGSFPSRLWLIFTARESPGGVTFTSYAENQNRNTGEGRIPLVTSVGGSYTCYKCQAGGCSWVEAPLDDKGLRVGPGATLSRDQLLANCQGGRATKFNADIWWIVER